MKEVTPSDRFLKASRRLGFKPVGMLPGATCSEVRSGVTSQGLSAVLKVADIGTEESKSIETLNAFEHFGGVHILCVDSETNGVLMPLLTPGTDLASAGLDDHDATCICAKLILTLRKAPIVEVNTLAEWFQELWDADATIPLVMKARDVARHLLLTTDRNCLLHGDLHHFNMLLGDQGWTVIDPKGVIGDPAFEITGFMRNPVGLHLGADCMRQRLETFAELLGDPIERLWGWSFCQTVLSYVWGDCSGFSDSWKEAATAILAAGEQLGLA